MGKNGAFLERQMRLERDPDLLSAYGKCPLAFVTRVPQPQKLVWNLPLRMGSTTELWPSANCRPACAGGCSEQPSERPGWIWSLVTISYGRSPTLRDDTRLRYAPSPERLSVASPVAEAHGEPGSGTSSPSDRTS